MNDTHRRILFFIDRLLDQRMMYEAVKSNEEERKTSKKLGMYAVNHIIVYFILMAVFAACAILTFVFFNKSWIWQGVITLIVGIACLPYAIIYFILALNCSVKQLSLNKQPIGLITLLITLLILVAAIVAVAVTILVMSV